jgi:hypothetical protein
MSAAAIEVKSLTANGVAFKVTGKSTHENHTSGMVSSFEDPQPPCTADLIHIPSPARSQICRQTIW